MDPIKATASSHCYSPSCCRWRLLENLIGRFRNSLYSTRSRRSSFSYHSKTHSYQQWAKALNEYASSQTLQEEIPYWQQDWRICSTLSLLILIMGPLQETSARTICFISYRRRNNSALTTCSQSLSYRN